MTTDFQYIVYSLIRMLEEESLLTVCDFSGLPDMVDDGSIIAEAMNHAFLKSLADYCQTEETAAVEFLHRMTSSSKWSEAARFYLRGVSEVYEEIEKACSNDPDFSERLKSLKEWMSKKENIDNLEETREKIWSVFFPEAVGIINNREEKVKELRSKRTVTIIEPNMDPITDPARQILFASNVLLTMPPLSGQVEDLPLKEDLIDKLKGISGEQKYWYDHPVGIGTEQKKNEILYGLRGLEEMSAFERNRGNLLKGQKIQCILSVSVTHNGLHDVAREYIKDLLTGEGGFETLDIYLFSETDTQRIIKEVIVPAAKYYIHEKNADALLSVFGVDGEYGRHYSFLKAVSAFWQVFIQPDIKGTFKIDLDQVFPQEELVSQTGFSAFEHFRTTLWGARGSNAGERGLDLGMIAGALVNKEDIDKSIFTPDVSYPEKGPSPDEYIFYSTLPQAMSTEAEMMTRYSDGWLDGGKRCIQRIHVTGGTNGILVESLRRHRSFTPSFIGRAEDQAYIFSSLSDRGERLAYVHKAGLIMRHDKESFAREAIRSAHVSKLIGDYIRILYFSAYAELLDKNIQNIKEIVDPFTGCFISRIPITVVYLRFAFRAGSFFKEGDRASGLEFVEKGAGRIRDSMNFVKGRDSMMRRQYEKERAGWNLYYHTLLEIEKALAEGDRFALSLKERAEKIIDQCHVTVGD